MSLGYVLLVGLPGLASVAKDMPSPADIIQSGVPRVSSPAQRRRRGSMKGRIVGGGNQEGGSEQDVKWNKEKLACLLF